MWKFLLIIDLNDDKLIVECMKDNQTVSYPKIIKVKYYHYIYDKIMYTQAFHRNL